MKILTATAGNKSVSFNCAVISRVEETLAYDDKCIIYTHNEIHGVMVDMSYLEVVGFLKAIE
jgi:hypothetical protein